MVADDDAAASPMRAEAEVLLVLVVAVGVVVVVVVSLVSGITGASGGPPLTCQ